jgi:hypothetical protein
MSVQQEIPEVFEDELDALRAVVARLGGAKTVGARLWPAKSVADAQRDLLDSLNRDRPRKLEFHEILRLLLWARETGFHSAKHFLDRETGYESSRPMDPEDEKAKLQREVIEASRVVKNAVDRLEQLARSPLQVVKP